MVFIIYLGLSEESSQWSYVFRYSQVMHNMYIVELCILLGVKGQLAS